MSETTTQQRGRRKVMQGVVVSDKMDKTIVVLVEDRVKHPLYGKVMTKSSRIKVHDEDNTAGVGDRVRVMETRPLSAQKRWRLVEIIEPPHCAGPPARPRPRGAGAVVVVRPWRFARVVKNLIFPCKVWARRSRGQISPNLLLDSHIMLRLRIDLAHVTRAMRAVCR